MSPLLSSQQKSAIDNSRSGNALDQTANDISNVTIGGLKFAADAAGNGISWGANEIQQAIQQLVNPAKSLTTAPKAAASQISPMTKAVQQVATPTPQQPTPTMTQQQIAGWNDFDTPTTQAAKQLPTPTPQPLQPEGATSYEVQAAPIFRKYGVPIAGGLGIWAQEGRGKGMPNTNDPYDIGAYTSNPDNAKNYNFKNPIEGTEAGAAFMAGKSPYQTPQMQQFFQKALAQYHKDGDLENWIKTINKHYATDKNWASGAIGSPEYKRWLGM